MRLAYSENIDTKSGTFLLLSKIHLHIPDCSLSSHLVAVVAIHTIYRSPISIHNALWMEPHQA